MDPIRSDDNLTAQPCRRAVAMGHDSDGSVAFVDDLRHTVALEEGYLP